MTETRARRSFLGTLQDRWCAGYALCVGLDPIFESIPAHLHSDGISSTLLAFNQAIIDATADYVCAFKPNAAFYEMHGAEGFAALIQTCAYIREHYPHIALILDAKRGDIGSTNIGYAVMAYDRCQADAVTVHPYLGREALEPLLSRPGRCALVLCRTSNPGAGEFQDLPVNGEPLYMHVARAVATRWNTDNTCGLVVGATYPRELEQIRAAVGELPILVPGIGAQGGDIEEVVEAGLLPDGGGLIISSSRSILYAGDGHDFADAARRAGRDFHDTFSKARRRHLERPDKDRKNGDANPASDSEFRFRRTDQGSGSDSMT